MTKPVYNKYQKTYDHTIVAVLTEQGMLKMLADLCDEDNPDILKKQVAFAVEAVTPYADNAYRFGQETNALRPLVLSLFSNDSEVMPLASCHDLHAVPCNQMSFACISPFFLHCRCAGATLHVHGFKEIICVPRKCCDADEKPSYCPCPHSDNGLKR